MLKHLFLPTNKIKNILQYDTELFTTYLHTVSNGTN